MELYHFKKKYPNTNVEPFIKNTAPFFQSFIEKSLKAIALENEGGVTENGTLYEWVSCRSVVYLFSLFFFVLNE